MPNEKDITEKMLLQYNDVFADIFNVLLFKGVAVIGETELQDSGVHSQLKIDGKAHVQERDIAKIWSPQGIRLALYGIENQSKLADDMPLRVFSYDGAVYKAQVNQRLSAKKTDRFPVYPAITIVLNFNKKRWNKPKSLFECLGPDVPEVVKQFANDYRIHVFDIAWMSLDEVAQFKSDFRYVAELFVRNRLGTLSQMSSEGYRHADEMLRFFDAVIQDKKVHHAIHEALKQGGRRTMSDIVRNLLAEGRAEGRAEGMAEGRAEGEANGQVLGIVGTLKSIGQSMADAIDSVSAQMSISRKEAEEKVRSIWDTI